MRSGSVKGLYVHTKVEAIGEVGCYEFKVIEELQSVRFLGCWSEETGTGESRYLEMSLVGHEQTSLPLISNPLDLCSPPGGPLFLP